jgi:FlaA1/EpsC-like NDP-sugar epimerase/UDP-N-acetylmuramyl pentapeptide phosphotransferase/UDP-N-acetylglucosamine-1-phosphate transferase
MPRYDFGYVAIAGGAAFAAAVLLTALVRRFLVKRRMLDVPNGRSSHAEPKPRGGGIGIVAALLAAVLLFVWTGATPGSLGWALLVGGATVAAVGLADDRFHVPARVRLLVHFLAAGWALWQLGGIGTLHLGRLTWAWGWTGQLLALGGLVWMINLYNFMDGIDGLAGLEALCAGGLGALLLAASGLGGHALVAAVLAGASAGFLVWNWPPAKIFMGDAGSGFLGFVFGVLILSSAKEQPSLLWPWLILLSAFLVDSTWTLLRRLVSGARWYEAHCSHAYQHAAREWRSHGKVTATVAAVNLAWLFPLAWGALAAPAAGPLLALVALAPLAWLAFRYHAGRDASASEDSPGASAPWGWTARASRRITRARLPARVAQLTVFVLAALGAFLFRFEFSIPPHLLGHLLFGVIVWAVVKSAVFHLHALHCGWWRYVSTPDLVRIARANLIGSLAGGLVILLFGPPAFPRSLYFLDFVLCLLATTGIRVVVRLVAEAAAAGAPGACRRTLIYGAGAAGVMVLRECRANPGLNCSVVGFIDDEPTKKGTRIQGVTVLGAGSDLPALAARFDVQQVLIALPSASGAEMTRILRLCQDAHVSFRTVPTMAEMIEGYGLAVPIRDVAVEDLLGRTPVRLEEHQIRASLENKVVMVTGAAGSIGSELCRQIARFRPAGIVGFDIAETPLFEIDREMRQAFPHVPFHPEIGSIQNRARLDDVLRQHRPSVVYHAAAYKHVPMMEAHVFEAIENNIFGTYNLAVAAADNGVADFVMISSDKAVRPTNVMGATKRVAELLLLALQNGRTKYVAVRFGNVLGSSGSVIPIFKKQIAAGGPVTVTHPAMRRYFMTIPEACQLVLQASVIGKGGQICVLDMGDPVKIVDLARNLILLSGRKPDEDIRVEFTGMRPGEKLYEELNTMDEDTVPTTHEKIRIFVGSGAPEDDMLAWLEMVREICEARDAGRLVLALKEVVRDYNTSATLLKRVIEARDRRAVVLAG